MRSFTRDLWEALGRHGFRMQSSHNDQMRRSTRNPNSEEAMRFDVTSVIAALGGISPIGGTVHDPCVPVSEREMAQLEQRLGVSLPAAYRTFVGAFGACRLGPGVGDYNIEFPWDSPIPEHISHTDSVLFGSFYGSDATRQASSRLSWQLDAFQDRIPEELIPIADCCGNKLCLGVRGGVRGHVWYWDAETEPEDEADYVADYGTAMPLEVKWQNLFHVASDFERFVLSLRRVEEV